MERFPLYHDEPGRVNRLDKEVTVNMDSFELGIAVQKIYDFIWDEFCDWYIEMVKPRLWNKEDPSRTAALWTLRQVLLNALKMLHPYMPFITEEIFCNLSGEESIMISSWPEYQEEWNFAPEERAIGTIKEAVRGIRNVRADMNVPNNKKATVYVVSENPKVREIFSQGKSMFAALGFASEVLLLADKTGIDESAVSVMIPEAAIYMPLAELLDIAKEKERLKKEEARLEKERAASSECFPP